MTTQLDFYTDITQDELDAAAKNSALGFQSRWEVNVPYTCKVSGTPRITYGEKFGNEELVVPVSTMKDGAWVDAGELRIATGGAKEGSENATSVAAGDAKAVKAQKANIRKMDDFLKATIGSVGYANYQEMKSGKKTISLDANGNPLAGKVKADLDVRRQASMTKLIAQFAKGERLDILVDTVFVNTPSANENNPSFPYNNFSKHEDSAS
jgi:hypothetical protein